MRVTSLVVTLVLAAAPLPPVAAQTAVEHLVAGDNAYTALHPDTALVHYQAALALDSSNYEALWKAARSIADVAKQLQSKDNAEQRRRDSLYTVGRGYAEAAIRAHPDGANGHYTLAMVLGRLSRTKGSKERVRFAEVIFNEASRAVAIDSGHDGAHHVLGAWHAEVKRLSGIQRFFAKALFGGGFMSKASWDWAVWHLNNAVHHNPANVYHRLELAEVFVDVGRYKEAREQLDAIPALPLGDVLDTQYKREAADLLARIRDKKDKT